MRGRLHKMLTVVVMIFIMGISTGCVRNNFKIEFQMPSDINYAYTIVYYASDSRTGAFLESAISIQKGKGERELPLRNPSLVEISSGSAHIFIYAERGDVIKITGESNDMWKWNVSGNALNEEWSRWRNANAATLASGDAAKINAAVASFVKKNPEKPLSTLLLLCRYDRRLDNTGFLRLWNLLKGEAAREKWIDLPGRNDLITGMPVGEWKNDRQMDLVLRTIANGIDTVSTGKVPVVLLFRRNTDPDNKMWIDSLRSLRKENPDSADFIIADICFDSDSVSWAAPLRRDSLKGVIRAWNPLAETDSVMRQLGVERTPMMIRIDPIKK